MKSLFVFVLLLATLVCQAQTKIIAHKSHSGSKHSFSKAYQHNLFNINASNFGNPPEEPIILLDTVIALNNSLTILKFRESLKEYILMGDYKVLKLTNKDFKFKADTLRNDKIYRKNNTANFIKSSGYRPIRFRNPIEEVIFIGFKE